jgi:hypothetical protein
MSLTRPAEKSNFFVAAADIRYDVDSFLEQLGPPSELEQAIDAEAAVLSECHESALDTPCVSVEAGQQFDRGPR